MMTRSNVLPGALGALLLIPLLSSCNLIDVTGTENANSGRGARVFDPYQAAASGAIKLSLQMINGCAYTPSGGFVAKHSMMKAENIPYPDVCANMNRNTLFADPTGPFDPAYVPVQGKLTLLSNTTYFLNQFSVSELLANRHKNPTDMTEFIRWVTKETRFKNLDWSGLGQVADEWEFNEKFPNVTTRDSWHREVLFDNAKWQRATDDTFKVEILDVDGVVRASQTYDHSEFLVESPYAGHSRIGWRMENVAAPLSPEDKTPRVVPTPSGHLPNTPTYRSIMRMDLVGSTNPFKTLEIGPLQGEYVLRVTWSLLPDEPFFFPVTIISQDAVPATCTDDQGNAKQCGFGLKANLNMVTPVNKAFYEPGEEVNMFVEYRDDENNRLHPEDLVPSPVETFTDRANGLLSVNPALLFASREADSSPFIMVAGPLQDMKVHSEVIGPKPYLTFPKHVGALISELASTRLLTNQYGAKVSTRFSFRVPADAKPGTYAVYIKGARYYLGERVSRLKPFFFQVGQEQLTSYPGKVGNCQICHRGVLSLDNLRHGLAVDHVEGCKACHGYSNDQIYRPQETIHRIHMRSKKFPVAKNECQICHLTRESATRPSVTVCRSCHPSTHDNQYFAAQFNSEGQPNRHSNCAQACHSGDQTPKAHILPEN